MNFIIWPDGFVPGFTDNFVSNEMIISGLSVNDVWPLLSQPFLWPDYYQNAADVRFYDNKGPELEDGVRFYFTTFGFPVESRVVENVPPAKGQPARLAWHGWSGEENTAERLDVHHAWLLEDLPGGRVRILTQETQNGAPARELAVTRPNSMLNGHQEWLDGLVEAAIKKDPR
ncbi:SRPBCC domain-containing protein [Enterobacteriaceae bacterium H11S18]|uniref:SRPBCC domain-containing protein n=1 Tax=Dryocola clanedunensis TaxID=2925396 RepID=UPI0022F13F60|nr:SRPBCC domain-containing protein [Dryocola clanedunensis]MCT4711659.1 SRPBCC domain-containing protein [Dryocola clanedunensis]